MTRKGSFFWPLLMFVMAGLLLFPPHQEAVMAPGAKPNAIGYALIFDPPPASSRRVVSIDYGRHFIGLLAAALVAYGLSIALPMLGGWIKARRSPPVAKASAPMAKAVRQRRALIGVLSIVSVLLGAGSIYLTLSLMETHEYIWTLEAKLADQDAAPFDARALGAISADDAPGSNPFDKFDPKP